MRERAAATESGHAAHCRAFEQLHEVWGDRQQKPVAAGRVLGVAS